MEALKQYEIWWADLPKPAGRRAVLLLSRDDAYTVLNKFVAAEITAAVRDIPIEVPLGSTEGMPKPCVVNCDNLRTISKVHLESPRGEAGNRLRFGVGGTDRCRGVAERTEEAKLLTAW